MISKFGPHNRKPTVEEQNPAERFMQFIQILSSDDRVSKADIQEKLNIRYSAFYKYMKLARRIVPIHFVGNIGGNAYYSIDKTALAKYFNIKHHHTSSP